MSLKERVYSVLVVSASDRLNASLPSLFPEFRYRPVRVVSNLNAAKRAMLETSFDFIIINSPLPDGTGTRMAIDICANPCSVVLQLVGKDLFSEISEKATEHGVFLLVKPTSRPLLAQALDWMASTRERIRQWEKRTVSVEEKMEEIRVVNRAKWLLIDQLKMTEPAAHRYIEKQAMDRCVPRREIAENIIHTYL